ncbi:MAG: methylmalonyl Co-A mutase-associated GTPase MeaB [Desulfobacterales bacterium]|nr:methylmalonyl Co-A mutase-associated GTPase MeaB [Desulfobacterales bacterium]
MTSNSSIYKKQTLSIDDYVDGILNKNRMILARAITLVESNAKEHIKIAQELMRRILPYSGNSIRIGITGVPGVGKSSFIETLGAYILEQGNKLAVLAIDPTSSISGGSILGDKTRMEKISRDERCFIRPSPSGGMLGGVARKTRESMLICEAAGFDIIFIETVGVGQNEITVRSMVDFFLLLMLSGAGDELQGIKKGIIEIADAILINKADGPNKPIAELARNEYERALHYISSATEGWKTHVYTCSALTGEGISEIWDVIQDFKIKTKESGIFASHRNSQRLEWLHRIIDEHLKYIFFKHPQIAESLPSFEKLVKDGKISPAEAAEKLINLLGI